MKKKSMAIKVMSLLTAAMMVLTACGSSDTSSSATGDASTGEKTVKLKFAGQYPTEHGITKVMEEFKERVETESNGTIEIEVYPANQLGDYTQVYEEIMKGSIEMGLISVPSTYDAGLELTYLHGIATDYDQAKEMYQEGSTIYNIMSELHDKQGVKFLGTHVEGFGGITTAKEMTNPAEPGASKGLLIRVPPMDVYKLWAEDMGYSTVSIPFAEVYTALQTGVADGTAGLTPVAAYTGYKDVMKYYYQNRGYFENVSFLINKSLFESMSENQQQILANAAKDYCDASFDLAKQMDEENMQLMKDAGITVVEFTDEELEAMAEFTRETTWPKLKDRLGEDIINELLANYE